MSELDLTRQDDQTDIREMFDRLSPAQQQQFMQSFDNQETILPYQFRRPENFGQAIGNVFGNLRNQIGIKYGTRPDPSGILANQKYLASQFDLMRSMDATRKEQNFRLAMIERGVDPNIANNASVEVLGDILKERQSKPFYGPAGNMYTQNKLTGEITKVTDLPKEIQEYYLNENFSQPGPELNQDQANLIKGETVTSSTPAGFSADRSVPKVGPYESQRRKKLGDTLGEKNQATVLGLGTTYSENSYGAAEQLKRLSDMKTLLEQGTRTGGGQELITGLQNLGFNLGLTDADPTMEQVFSGLATGFILPLAKTLGVNPTDRDMELIGTAAADLSKTPLGNMIIIQTKMIELERARLIQREWLDYTENNMESYKFDPTTFKNGWERKLFEIQQSPEFKGADVLRLKAQAASALNMQPDVNAGLKRFEKKKDE